MRGLTMYEQRFRPFKDEEAWTLYRLAAFGEAFGWTLLLIGLGLKKFVLHGNNLPVLISGQIHGTFFLLYITAVIVLYPSLAWSRLDAVVAGLASVPPYGSLIMEQWLAHRRWYSRCRCTIRLVLYYHLVK